MSDNAAELAGIAQLRCRAERVRLGAGPSPEQLALRLRHRPGLVVLRGEWAGGTAIVACDPLATAPPGADAAAIMGVQPVVAEGTTDDVVGGGWFGWLGYDGTHQLAFYDQLLRLVDGDWYIERLVSDERADLLRARHAELAGALAADEQSVDWCIGDAGGADRDAHLAAVERAIGEVRAGEIYQANICTRLSGTFRGDPLGLFAQAAAQLRPVFGAYVAAAGAPTRTIVSLSPELFLRRRGRAVLTKPIKGTWPRTGGVADSGALALRASAKDAAENVMIVDLMRNDLGRVCRTGSVRPTALLAVEPHPGLWHLVSTVAGELRDDAGDADLIRATFPPGSVTGAPKSRAVQVIAACEAQPRGTYTGAVGFASPAWGLELNVAIRTFEITGDRYELGVGGGITADSVPMREWRECLDKAAPLLAAAGASGAPAGEEARPTEEQLAGGLLETVLVRAGRPLRLADHLARLDRSARELYGRGIPVDLAARVRQCAATAGTTGRAALRVVLGPDVAATVTCVPAGPPPERSDAVSVRRRDGCWRHKWADRIELSAAEQAAGADLVPLFCAADGTLLETSRGNLFVVTADGAVHTPPLSDAVLPGVTRRAVLDLAHDRGWAVRLGPVAPAELRVARTVFWTSSLSLAVPIRSLDGVALPSDYALVRDIGRALEFGGSTTLR